VTSDESLTSSSTLDYMKVFVNAFAVRENASEATMYGATVKTHSGTKYAVVSNYRSSDRMIENNG